MGGEGLEGLNEQPGVAPRSAIPYTGVEPLLTLSDRELLRPVPVSVPVVVLIRALRTELVGEKS